MVKRVTVIFDDDLVKKLREKQSKLIKESTNFVSFSSIVNNVVREGLKKI